MRVPMLLRILKLNNKKLGWASYFDGRVLKFTDKIRTSPVEERCIVMFVIMWYSYESFGYDATHLQTSSKPYMLFCIISFSTIFWYLVYEGFGFKIVRVYFDYFRALRTPIGKSTSSVSYRLWRLGVLGPYAWHIFFDCVVFYLFCLVEVRFQ